VNSPRSLTWVETTFNSGSLCVIFCVMLVGAGICPKSLFAGFIFHSPLKFGAANTAAAIPSTASPTATIQFGLLIFVSSGLAP
jgi:hypothetical protein